MINNLLIFIFWLSLAVIGFSYVVYPIILLAMSALRQVYFDSKNLFVKENRRIQDVGDLPEIAVVFSAYNEEKNIVDRLNNLLSLDYPNKKLKIYVGNDGSQDKTSELISNFDDPRIVFFDFEKNRGKATVLNDLMDRVTEGLVIFTDANTCFNCDVAKKIIRHFANDRVGAVCGELNLIDSESKENKDGIYWKYERLLKFHEGRLGCLLGANGAIYCIRRSLWQPIAIDTVVDDFTIVLNVSLQGYRVVYDAEAIATEEVAPDAAGEYKRRVRIGVGNYQACQRFRSLLSPVHGMLWFSYLSHKIMRWFTPHVLLLMLVTSLFVGLDNAFYLVLFLLQVVLYLLAFYYRNRKLPVAILRLPVFWINMNVALAHGFIKYCHGGVSGAWARTER